MARPPRPLHHRPQPLQHLQKRQVRRQAGVSLIELMVGLTIGLLAVLVITQVVRLYEGQKRNTTGGADAQINGAVALHHLQREVQRAGWGLTNSGAAGCDTYYKLLGEAAGHFTLAAAQIVDGASGAPDEIQLMRGDDRRSFAVPLKIKGHFRNATAFDLDGATNLDIARHDLLLAVPQTYTPGTNWCVLFNASADFDAAAPLVIKHEANATDGRWNHDGNTNPDNLYPGATSTTAAFAAGSHVIDLGQLVMMKYRLSGVHLQSATRTFGHASASTGWSEWTEMAPHIVDLQAVYGKDTSTTADNVADVWNADTPADAQGWSRVVAVRIVVVARSTHYEKDPVTVARPSDTNCALGPPATGNYPVWSPAGDGTWACLGVDRLTDWQHYQYKTFETVVPLRNMLWQS